MASRLFDKYGNELRAENGRVYLKLKDSNRERFLGVVRGDTFTTFRKQVHRFNSMDAIGFNWHLINRGKFHNIEVELETGEVLRTTREHVSKVGKALMFKKQGHELQIFLPVEQFTTEVTL